ncbi:hypothetical protein IQ249_13515 [Lusitaniella coriacea LEGE 07157]|uniref:DDE transposase family protein n=1 Tax=Lusitaniella coriacea LEGE 07157 TaxID=945747 RepID=A0A8J7JBE0_9CYAN|nr:hypothetical protein [Lusitaniella coriacea]MBE9116920.1 hypothetical protein [Lusitaniella coriacea LEGE 07157]
MENTQNWYIVKNDKGQCEIVPGHSDNADSSRWGPFSSVEEAIARRVGLIRAGKCQPV